MNNLKKIIFRILIFASVILILVIGLFIFLIKRNEIKEFDKRTDRNEQFRVELKGTERIPKNAFWIEKNGKGFWYNVDFLHNHKNNVRISIFDKYGERIEKGHFILICPSDEIEFIDELETQIDFYDGESIHFKSNCYLMKRSK